MGKAKTRKPVTSQQVTEAVSQALRNALRDTATPVKDLAARTGRNVEAAKNWLEGRNAPRAAELIELMAEFDEVHLAVLQLSGRTPSQVLEVKTEVLALLDELRRILSKDI